MPMRDVSTKLCACGCGLSTGGRFARGHNRRIVEVNVAYRKATWRGASMALHLAIAERAIGKRLPPGAQVHHVNGDRYDNRRTNLVICQDAAYHRLLHRRQRVISLGGNPDTQRWCAKCLSLQPSKEFETMRFGRQCDRPYCAACQRQYDQERWRRPEVRLRRQLRQPKTAKRSEARA